ncbi:MAG: response regulator [Anaerolineales bacterium]|nr:response regulator [Anaerolineales bacterium]
MARIYVIDDDEQLLRMVGLMLDRGGHATTLINDPVEGLEQIKQNKPDLLVLDVMMPDMSGHDIARQIRAQKGLESLPILILTARSQEVDRATALKSGADDYLSKPVTSQELIERVDNLLHKRENRTRPEQGILIVMFGMRGGVGQTTLAVNLASALRRLSQEEVCLVDLSPSGGQAAMHLRLQARTTWADLPTANELDWSVFKEKLTIHPSGLRLLAAPSVPQSATEPAPELVEAFLPLLQGQMTFTVVDMPRVFSPTFTAVLEAADIALHVLAADVVSVQTAVQVDRLLSKTGISFRQKSYVLNHIQPEAELPQTTVERGLNARVASKINFDPNQSRALAQGVPLTLTSAKSPLPTMMNRMAEVIWQRVVNAAAKK